MTARDRANPNEPRPDYEADLEGLNLQEIGLERTPKAAAKKGERGVMRGTVVGVTGDDVIVELGPRMQGVISVREFDEAPAVGAAFDFTLHGREDDLWKLLRNKPRAIAVGDDIEVGAVVKGKVTGQNTGGLELKVGNSSAFMPASQVALAREENLGQFVGQMLTCEVVDIDRERRRIVVSRRAVLEKERNEARKETVGKLSTGQTVRGKVTRVESFGAFVDLGGGVEGMIHVSNLSHKRVETATEALKPGDEVEAQIVAITDGGKRIGLSKKALEADPWATADRKLAPNQVITGKVTRVMDFGAFVELEPGLEGLVHVSQLAKDRVRRPSDLVKPGQELQVRVIAVDRAKSRISLSRLDVRGALLGSEDSVESHVIDQVLRDNTPSQPMGTNLGNLFKRALDKK